ncbi:MAG TPA: diacylglycerol kinase family protein [Polyangiaceae bacterium]|nr:diacylglycerol kinase family protein [Polyangiaceae bacterium]
MKFALIVNPTAGSGSAGRVAPTVQRALERRGIEVTVCPTAGPGDATRFAGESRASAADCTVVVGGDGTLNEVCQAYLDARGEPLAGPPLGIVPAGTGGDFRKTLELDTDVERSVERLLGCEPRAFDLGILSAMDHDGRPVTRAFVNIASFGLGGLTDRVVNAGPKWLGGRSAFFLGTLRALIAYRNAAVRVTVDGAVWLESPVVNVALANGRYFGGGMQIAPEADPTDGLLDVVALGDLTRLGTVALTQSVYTGTHLDKASVEHTRGRVIEAEPLVPGAEVLIDLDGETPGRLPLAARVAAGALWLRA